MGLGHLGLLISASPEEKQTFHISGQKVILQTGARHPLKLGPYPPTGTGGNAELWESAFRRNGSQIFKTVLGCRRYISKGQRRDLQLQFLEVNASKKSEVRAPESGLGCNKR